jgi:diphthine synthase
MTLYMIGLGLWDETDITLKGLEAIKRSDIVYLETYTSKLNVTIADLEKFYGKKIIPADREMAESKTDEILRDANKKDIAFLVIGDPFGATTHTAIILRAKEKKIPIKIIHNASIINAIGITGLELYKFGKITSIPFDNKNIRSPIEAMLENQKNGLHTLFLLDLMPKDSKYMQINEAVEFLLRIGLKPETLCIGCAGIGSEKPEIKAKTAFEMLKERFTLLPQCLIIPGKLHFVEEEALLQWE